MNEPDEFESMHERAIVRLHSASGERGCAVIVGRRWAAGGRACGHARAEHQGSHETEDALCLGCEREGVALGHSTSVADSRAGRDHMFTGSLPPASRHEQQERAAA